VCAAGRRQADLDFLERKGTQVWGKAIKDIKNIPIWNSALKNIFYYHIIIIYSKSYMIYCVPGML
jgi:hypothetical protein